MLTSCTFYTSRLVYASQASQQINLELENRKTIFLYDNDINETTHRWLNLRNYLTAQTALASNLISTLNYLHHNLSLVPLLIFQLIF